MAVEARYSPAPTVDVRYNPAASSSLVHTQISVYMLFLPMLMLRLLPCCGYFVPLRSSSPINDVVFLSRIVAGVVSQVVGSPSHLLSPQSAHSTVSSHRSTRLLHLLLESAVHVEDLSCVNVLCADPR